MRDRVSILPLEVERLALQIDGRRLVDDVSFTLAAGGLTVVIGPNGAGKSMLLRLLHGLVGRTDGRLDWSSPEGRRAGVKAHAMVFQKPIMLRRSVLGNITHALAAAGWGHAARLARARAALERFRLQDFADRPARRLSGGEQQRLAIARAWALDPEVLFLDEPTSQLDPSATRMIEEMIAALTAEGRTVIMATHDLGQARRLADRVFFIQGGRLREDAPATLFFEHPQTEAARAFLAGDLVV